MDARLQEKQGEFGESLSETDWAWIAGMIDGEGMVALRYDVRMNKHKKHDWSQVSWESFLPRLGVYNTNRASIEFIARAFKCEAIRRFIQKYNNLAIFAVETTAREKLLTILPRVMPYLRIKAERAKLLYELVQLPRGSGPEKRAIFDRYRALVGNAEPSQRMKDAAGRCDGQSGTPKRDETHKRPAHAECM
jgi:hypothetical protein